MGSRDVLQADVVVVGSGPGGATVARQLAREGKNVALLERGADYRRGALYGTYPGALTYADRRALLFTREGLNVIRPLMMGGATSMYCGCAARPPAWLERSYGVRLDDYVNETIAELRIAPLAPELRGGASTRIAEAAGSLGYAWEPMPKFVNPARARHFDCSARCMLGCRCGAKWNAAEWVDEAMASGCRVLTRARVDEVMVEDGCATGVRGQLKGEPFEVLADTVVLAAGGIGTPVILRRSGLHRAGRGIAMDTTAIVYGTSREQGNAHDPPMTYAWADDDKGYLLSTLIDPWLMYPLSAALGDARRALTWPRWRNTLGVMVKLKDDVSGEVSSERAITKPLTPQDRLKLEHATTLSRRILVEAGARPDSIFVSSLRGTHPCATVRVGDLLDRDLQTEIPGLYVCDASALPEALARPTVLTIIALGKRLATFLLGRG